MIVLARVYTMPELAAMIAWSRRRLVRHLKRLNKERDGDLLVNAGTDLRPKWTVTLEALRSAAPQWFRDPETIEARLDAVEETAQLAVMTTGVHTKKIASMNEEIKHLHVVVDTLSKNLRAVVTAA